MVADRRAAPHPPARRGRGPPQPVLLRGGAVRRRPGRAGRDRARARRPARAAGAVLRLLDRRRHGRAPRGRRRHAGAARCSCTARPRCGSSARAWTGSRACSRTPRCGSRSPRSSTESLEPDAEELPSAAVPAPPAPRVGAAADQARLRPPPARQHADAARARARLRRRAGAAARPRARARPPQLAPRRAAARSGGCCGRSTSSASTSPGSTSARARASCARRRRAILPGYADADEPRRQALLTEALASGRRGIEHDPGGEAGELLRVLDTVALSAEAYGPQAVPAFVISMTEQPSDVLAATWLAQRAGRDRRCGWCRCSRPARRSSRRRRRWPSCTPASPTSRTCARRPTARR